MRPWRAGIVATCLIMFCCFGFPIPAEADTLDQPAAVSVEPISDSVKWQSPAGAEGQPVVDLEQAITIARQAFTVPRSLDQFSSGFREEDSASTWDLSWYTESETARGQLNVSVDAVSGEILNMSMWLPQEPGMEETGLPRYTKEQGESIAIAFAKRMQPERFAQTKLTDMGYDNIQPLLSQWGGQTTYYYNFVRYIEDAVFPENGITISVNGHTGAVSDYQFMWRDSSSLPPVHQRISQAEAEQIMREQAAPEMIYYRAEYPGQSPAAKLVFQLPDESSIGGAVIDAVNGEILKNVSHSYPFLSGGFGVAEDSMASRSASKNSITLSPEEINRVDRQEQFITKEEALSIARATVNIPADYTLRSSRLMQDYADKEKMFWNLFFQPGDGKIYADGYADVSIDAVNGETTSFSIYNYNDEMREPEVLISEDEAARIAEDYLQRNQQGRIGQVVFKGIDPAMNYPGGREQKPYAYNIQFTRLVDGISFPQNGFNFTVNSTTGQITWFQLYWNELKFDTPPKQISPKEAADIYLERAPLEISYVSVRREGRDVSNSEIHLAYSMQKLYFSKLDAVTGESLDYRGQKVAPFGEKISYSDLEGHASREAVELLAAYKILEQGDGRFRPDEPVTNLDLVIMLVRAFNGPLNDEEAGTERYYQLARTHGILLPGENPAPNETVIREALACYLIRSAGLQKAARLDSIYNLEFNDAAAITPAMRGYVALASAMGYVLPTEGSFASQEPVTRGEAAEALVRLIRGAK